METTDLFESDDDAGSKTSSTGISFFNLCDINSDKSSAPPEISNNTRRDENKFNKLQKRSKYIKSKQDEQVNNTNKRDQDKQNDGPTRRRSSRQHLRRRSSQKRVSATQVQLNPDLSCTNSNNGNISSGKLKPSLEPISANEDETCTVIDFLMGKMNITPETDKISAQDITRKQPLENKVLKRGGRRYRLANEQTKPNPVTSNKAEYFSPAPPTLEKPDKNMLSAGPFHGTSEPPAIDIISPSPTPQSLHAAFVPFHNHTTSWLTPGTITPDISSGTSSSGSISPLSYRCHSSYSNSSNSTSSPLPPLTRTPVPRRNLLPPLPKRNTDSSLSSRSSTPGYAKDHDDSSGLDLSPRETGYLSPFSRQGSDSIQPESPYVDCDSQLSPTPSPYFPISKYDRQFLYGNGQECDENIVKRKLNERKQSDADGYHNRQISVEEQTNKECKDTLNGATRKIITLLSYSSDEDTPISPKSKLKVSRMLSRPMSKDGDTDQTETRFPDISTSASSSPSNSFKQKQKTQKQKNINEANFVLNDQLNNQTFLDNSNSGSEMDQSDGKWLEQHRGRWYSCDDKLQAQRYSGTSVIVHSKSLDCSPSDSPLLRRRQAICEENDPFIKIMKLASASHNT